MAGSIYKFGKADLERSTKLSNLPTRLHQQVRKLQDKFGLEKVRGSVTNPLGRTTTEKAKEVERQTIQNHVDKTGSVPQGNLKSFKIKNN